MHRSVQVLELMPCTGQRDRGSDKCRSQEYYGRK